MKKLKKLAMRYDAVSYIYAAGVLVVVAAPLINIYLMLYMIGCN